MRFSVLRLLIVVAIVAAWFALTRTAVYGMPHRASPGVADWIAAAIVAPVFLVAIVALFAAIAAGIWLLSLGIELAILDLLQRLRQPAAPPSTTEVED